MKKNTLKYAGHTLRLPEVTLARQAVKDAL